MPQAESEQEAGSEVVSTGKLTEAVRVLGLEEEEVGRSMSSTGLAPH